MTRLNLIVVFLAAVFALSVQAKGTSLPNVLFDGSDIEQYIEDFPALVGYGFAQQSRKVNFAPSFTNNKLQELKRSISTLDMNAYKDRAHARFVNQFDRGQIKQIVEWQQSGFGKRLLRLNKFSHTVDGMDQMKSFFQRQTPIEKDRFKDIKALVKHTRAAEILINVAAQTQTAIQAGIESMSQTAPQDYKMLYSRIKKSALKHHKEARAFVYADFIYTYRTFLKRDIGKLLTFVQSDLGRKYYTTRQKVITEIIVEMSRELSNTMLDLAKPVSARHVVAVDVDPQQHYAVDFRTAKKHYRAKRYAQAYPILERIAKKGHIDAQFTLGKMHQQGKHVSRDELSAYAWYAVAGNQGHTTAKNLGNSLLANFSIVDLSKAGKLSRFYVKNYHADAQKRHREAQKRLLAKQKREAELAENQQKIAKRKALQSSSAAEKRQRRSLTKRSNKHRQLLIERYPLPELMGKAPTILTK